MYQILDRQGQALFYFRWGCARHGGGDVQHRNQNLRLFFARNDGDREDSECQRCCNEERRQLGVEESVRQPPGHAQPSQLRFLFHCWTSMRLPARSRSAGSSTSFSPAEMPDSTSTLFSRAAPNV